VILQACTLCVAGRPGGNARFDDSDVRSRLTTDVRLRELSGSKVRNRPLGGALLARQLHIHWRSLALRWAHEGRLNGNPSWMPAAQIDTSLAAVGAEKQQTLVVCRSQTTRFTTAVARCVNRS
jgi:hypothetical protein